MFEQATWEGNKCRKLVQLISSHLDIQLKCALTITTMWIHLKVKLVLENSFKFRLHTRQLKLTKTSSDHLEVVNYCQARIINFRLLITKFGPWTNNCNPRMSERMDECCQGNEKHTRKHGNDMSTIWEIKIVVFVYQV